MNRPLAGHTPGPILAMPDMDTRDCEYVNAQIAALLADNLRLREALKRVHDDWSAISGSDHGAGDEYEDVRSIDEQSRAALAEQVTP